MRDVQVQSAAAATAYYAANAESIRCYYLGVPTNLGTTGEQPPRIYVNRPTL